MRRGVLWVFWVLLCNISTARADVGLVVYESMCPEWRHERVALTASNRLVNNCKTAANILWLEGLPAAIRSLERRWLMTIDKPFDDKEGSCAWVAPVLLANGNSAVLKLGMPHMEAEHEIQGMRFWDGNPTARLLDADEELGAMLLERCEPGTTLRTLPELEQDIILSGLLKRLWRGPISPHPFRPLSKLMDYWTEETLADADRWRDEGLVREGLRLLSTLPRTAAKEVLLATDLHAGNILRAQREPWLVIDPKPFVGDAAYDATQHLFNCDERLRSDPNGTIRRIADLLGLDSERVRLWMFARAAAEPRDNWEDQDALDLARVLAP